MLYISIAFSVVCVSIITILVIIAKMIDALVKQGNIQTKQIEKFNTDIAFIFSTELLENLKKYNAARMKNHVVVKDATGNYVIKKVDEEY